MTTASYIVEGNLAVAAPVHPAHAFTVVEGGRRIISEPASRSRVAASVSSSPARVLGAAVILVALAASLVLSGWISVVGRAAARDQAVADASFEVVTVGEGDSLWSLASDHVIDGLTIQETSDAIRDRNGLDTALLQPGMRLEVPRA